MPRLNAHLGYQFTEFEPMERFAQAASAGFKAVEWPAVYPYDPSRLREIIDSLGLSWVAVSLPFGDAGKGEKGMAALPGRKEEFIEGLRAAIRYANVLGAGLDSPHGGNRRRVERDRAQDLPEKPRARGRGSGGSRSGNDD